MHETFHIELAIARMAVGLAHRHRDDLGAPGLLHQVRRLEAAYREKFYINEADKLARILKWYDDGGPSDGHIFVLSEDAGQEVAP